MSDNYIEVAEVREEMLDRTYEDHLVLADLAFTDDDIVWAMKACARKFNSLQPYVCPVCWDHLPQATSCFFDGIAWALLRRWHRNASINDIDYAAGGVTASVQGKLVKNLGGMVAKLEEEFIRQATDLKLHINISQAFGQIG